jgi:hypothetical protein
LALAVGSAKAGSDVRIDQRTVSLRVNYKSPNEISPTIIREGEHARARPALFSLSNRVRAHSVNKYRCSFSCRSRTVPGPEMISRIFWRATYE